MYIVTPNITHGWKSVFKMMVNSPWAGYAHRAPPPPPPREPHSLEYFCSLESPGSEKRC